MSVTTEKLFALADAISATAGACHQTQQAAVTESLNSALRHVLDAAKAAAFREALDRHNTASLSSYDGKGGA